MTRFDPKPAITPNDQFALLMETYSRPLERFFRRRVRVQVEVDDLIQEVFYRLIRRHGQSEIENPQAYLFQIAANILRDRFRRAQKTRNDDHQLFDEALHAHDDISPERILIGRDQVRFLKSAMLELPEKTRNIFILQRFEDMKYHEIAVHLDISVSTVEKHMMKAIKHITGKVE
ncbi:MAG: sigma-70 family RNA polymerase sigma factor [Emcibacter sp.]|nr:sigma-70 family RNA polymerase sigma factor [Emcibacter sp.]